MVSLKEMAQSDAERTPPTWLCKLLLTTFFEKCPEHQTSEGLANKRTIGCNFFCTVCAGDALCSSCVGTHEGHEIIQIRRSSGHDVVKVVDVQHLLNVSLVQTYQYNGELVVFLNKRPMSGKGKHGTSNCEECERAIQDEACRFCSLGCKAKEIEHGVDFSVSFAINTNNNSGGVTEVDNNEESSTPSDNNSGGVTDADNNDESYNPSGDNEESSSPSEH